MNNSRAPRGYVTKHGCRGVRVLLPIVPPKSPDTTKTTPTNAGAVEEVVI